MFAKTFIMKKFLLLLLLCFAQHLWAQNFKTLTYYTNDSTKLELDLFLPKDAESATPLFIHVHGGGFSGGERHSDHDVCRYLATKGIASAAISYTLYMKGKSFSCDGILTEKVKAIQLAVNDLWQATLFFIDHSKEYNIDTSKIFISGSSAGAETVLHAAYWDQERMSLYPRQLPSGFKYAGLISGAGAIMDLNLITKENIIPTMLFHGSCDSVVPYSTAAHHYCPTGSPGWLMLFGSYSIFNHIKTLTPNAHLISYCGGGHEYSAEAFHNDPASIYSFIQRAMKKEKDGKHEVVATAKGLALKTACEPCAK